jgi:hypothetical protein
MAAARSSPEWAASARMPMLPLSKPTATFMPVSRNAAATEFSAARFFSSVAWAGIIGALR